MSGKYCEVPDKQQQTPHIIGTSEIEEASRVKQTPQGGIKRFLTPSPVLKCESLKKSRRLSGDLSEVSERLNMDENLDNHEAADTEVTEGCLLQSQWVKQILRELLKSSSS